MSYHICGRYKAAAAFPNEMVIKHVLARKIARMKLIVRKDETSIPVETGALIVGRARFYAVAESQGTIGSVFSAANEKSLLPSCTMILGALLFPRRRRIRNPHKFEPTCDRPDVGTANRTFQGAYKYFR